MQWPHFTAAGLITQYLVCGSNFVFKIKSFRRMSYSKSKDYALAMNLEYILHSVLWIDYYPAVHFNHRLYTDNESWIHTAVCLMNTISSTEIVTISVTSRRLIMLSNVIHFFCIKITVLQIVKNIVHYHKSVKGNCAFTQGLQKTLFSIPVVLPSGQYVLTSMLYIICISSRTE
jgi:hypothetical protein